MLITLNQALEQVKDQKKAIAAFNVFGYEDAQAVVDAAEDVREPVILMANKPALSHMPVEILGPILTKIASQSKNDVCVHLDHCTDYELVLRAIMSGFTSVMFDGSQLSVEENIRRTKEVVKAAHACGVSVEAEIGAVGYADGSTSHAEYTQPEQAVRFEQQAQPDALAIAVGTVHRMTTQSVKLDFDLMDRIVSQIHTPAVIHGSSGVTDKDLSKLVEHGAKKINIGTALRIVFGNTLREQMQKNPDEFDRIKMFGPCMKAVTEAARQKILLMRKEG